MPMNKVVHAAQRAAFSAAIDVAINAVRGKGTEKLSENAVKLVNLAEPLLKDRYPASAFDAARKFVSDPNGKWMQYAYRAINEIDGLWSFGPEYTNYPGATGLDTTKITVQVTDLGLSGVEAESILRHEYKVQCELSDAHNLLFILSYADGEEQADYLLEALQGLARDHRRATVAASAVAAELPAVPAPLAMTAAVSVRAQL